MSVFTNVALEFTVGINYCLYLQICIRIYSWKNYTLLFDTRLIKLSVFTNIALEFTIGKDDTLELIKVLQNCHNVVSKQPALQPGFKLYERFKKTQQTLK